MVELPNIFDTGLNVAVTVPPTFVLAMLFTGINPGLLLKKLTTNDPLAVSTSSILNTFRVAVSSFTVMFCVPLITGTSLIALTV